MTTPRVGEYFSNLKNKKCMNDNGNVYVLMNPSMKNLVKIGKTTRDPKERARELSSTTGVPTPFVVIYDCFFESCTQAEKFVHTYLENKGFRLSNNREFFEVPIKDAIDAVMKAREHFGEFIPKEENDIDENNVFFNGNEDDALKELTDSYNKNYKKPWDEIVELADTYYYGDEDEIQDFDEAMHHYTQAIKLGSVESYRSVGIMHKYGEGVKEDMNKAFKYFKEGAKNGDVNCYAEMAELFNDQENIENASKCWKKYFELITGDLDYNSGLNYISFIVEENLKLKYIDKLIIMKNEMLDSLERNINNREFEVLIPKHKKLMRFIKSNIINPSDTDHTIETEPQSFWKGLFK